MPRHVVEGIEELKTLIGQEVGVSDWFLVTRELIDAFADVCRDHQWIHVNAERAKNASPFGTTIAHGFLTLSLLTHLHTQAVQLHHDYQMALNYGFNRIRFTAPVPCGARIRSHSTLKSVADIPNGVQIAWDIKVEIEGQPKPALVAEWLGRLVREEPIRIPL
jgi:acyl dehydratase